MRVEWRNLTPRFVLSDQENENMLFLSVGIESTTDGLTVKAMPRLLLICDIDDTFTSIQLNHSIFV